MLSSTVTTRWQNIGSGGATLKLKGFRLKLLSEKFNFTRVESQRVLYVTDDREGSVPIPASTECFLRPTLQSGPETQLFFSFLFFRVFFFLALRSRVSCQSFAGGEFLTQWVKGGRAEKAPLSFSSFLSLLGSFGSFGSFNVGEDAPVKNRVLFKSWRNGLTQWS